MTPVSNTDLEQFIVKNVHSTGQVLGVGAYGSVEEVEIPGATVAGKKLHKTLVNLGSAEQIEKWTRDFMEECKLMSQLRHPHIVQFLGVCYLPGVALPVLLMEKLSTSLDNLLETKPNIPIPVKVHLLAGTSRGLIYLHSHDPPISHRDLSAKNILVNNGLNAKIADLGVSRIVNVQPGQLAATMTQMPGTGVYMPPEAIEDTGATRYNTSIDIFSLGVVCLFTLTQTFPKNLKPATYFDPATKKIVGRSEIERRNDYVVLMKLSLGETHALVALTLDCLKYAPENRPSAVNVLRRLEEVGTTLPQNCIQTGLQLTQEVQGTERVTAGKKEIFMIRKSNDQQNSKFQAHLADIDHLQAGKQEQVCDLIKTTSQLQAANDHLQATNKQLEATVYRLQAEKEEQCRKVASLSEEMNLLQMQCFGQSGMIAVAVKPPPWPLVPSSFTKLKDRPEGMRVWGQPVPMNRKLYMRGVSGDTETVVVYTPDQDNWDKLPSPPVCYFTVATLRGQLLLVGGEDKFTHKKTNTILTFDESSRRWLQTLPLMPMAVSSPTAVVEYQNRYLIVAGRVDSNYTKVTDVNILDAANEKWAAANPLPGADDYNSCLIIGDTVYLIGEYTKQAFRANVPALISGGRSGAWETIASIPWYFSFPVSVDNTLLILGGCYATLFGNTTADIHQYDLDKNQWIKCGDLPKPVICFCAELSDKLYVFEWSLL